MHVYKRRKVAQTAHNIIIAEENSELHIITGCSNRQWCTVSYACWSSEFYLKKGAKITFTMVHNWAEQVEVRPRTRCYTRRRHNKYISNYILTSPVNTIQTYPTAYCQGENSKVVFPVDIRWQKDSVLDAGSRAILTGKLQCWNDYTCSFQGW